MILAIDPGNIESAYAILDKKTMKPIEVDKCTNECLLERLDNLSRNKFECCAIEMVASYGMAVGASVFETCVWIGRFWEMIENRVGIPTVRIFRKDVKMNICGQTKAKDANIRQALIDRFGVVGTKKNPGWFYGFKSDIWAAYAVGVTYHDLYLGGSNDHAN